MNNNMKQLVLDFSFDVSPSMSMQNRMDKYREATKKLFLENYLFDPTLDFDILSKSFFLGINVSISDSSEQRPIPFNAINIVEKENSTSSLREYLLDGANSVEFTLRDLWSSFGENYPVGLHYKITRDNADDSWQCDIEDSKLVNALLGQRSFAQFWVETLERYTGWHSFYFWVYPTHLSLLGERMADVLVVSPNEKIVDLIIARKRNEINDLVSLIRSRYEKDMLAHARYFSLRSAIGSIMSRNGSHNIGSHVLAALSHNVGTMPDDRVLYQYIQHRMDYIATATTDFPTWRQPTMFLGTMMKTFLAQRHLLDHIAGSEGLKGWKFQDRNSPDGRATSGNGNCLQFRIYPNAKDEATGQWTRIIEAKQNGKEGFVECIDYDEGRMAHLSYDVSLAIPGGTVGQHAFFTIIENIIRNAAKHDWSSPPESKAKAENLEINIDFADIPEEGKVLFTISTNLSDVTETDDTSEKGVQLIEKINQKLSEPFIDSSGSLRRENWGLAEMKISAGYLQGREIGVIGGIESTDEKAKSEEYLFDDIIKAVEVDGGHLGYQFWIPKARTLLLVTDNAVGLDKDKEKFLAGNGIFVKTKKEIEPAKNEKGAARLDNSFEFVLVYNRQDEIEDWLPSRVVAASEPVETILEAIFAGTTTPKAVIDDVAAKYVKKLVGRENSLNLVVAPFHGGSGGGQSLINEAAAVAFVFENGFKEAVEAFKLLYLKGDVNGDVKQQDPLTEETRSALDFFLKKSSFAVISEELKRSDSKNYNELMTIQFKSWLEDVAGPDLPTIRPFIEKKEELDENHPYQSFCVYFGQVCKQAKGYLGLYAEKIATLPQGFEYEVSEKDVFPTTPWVDAATDITKVKDPKDALNCAKHGITVGFVRHYGGVKTSEKYLSAFVDNPFVGSRSEFRYLEPLSGSQSYLVQMQSLAAGDRIFQAKLVECALTRILIVDERVSKFAATHSADIRATLALMGIRVADDKAADDALNDRVAKECVAGLLQLPVEEIKALRTDIAESGNREVLRKRMEPRKKVQDEFWQKFDVLIIHQGILDKWFRGLVDNKNKMSLVLAALQEVFKQVVITTGRGTPANIPDKARVLPFSTIETTLFKKYPEKLILVDAIMNILPIHRN